MYCHKNSTKTAAYTVLLLDLMLFELILYQAWASEHVHICELSWKLQVTIRLEGCWSLHKD